MNSSSKLSLNSSRLRGQLLSVYGNIIVNMPALCYSVLEEQPGSLLHQTTETTGLSSVVDSNAHTEYHERQKKLSEARRRVKEERKKIVDQVKYSVQAYHHWRA